MTSSNAEDSNQFFFPYLVSGIVGIEKVDVLYKLRSGSKNRNTQKKTKFGKREKLFKIYFSFFCTFGNSENSLAFVFFTKFFHFLRIFHIFFSHILLFLRIFRFFFPILFYFSNIFLFQFFQIFFFTNFVFEFFFFEFFFCT